MTPKIRVKAFGIFKHKAQFLFSKHYDTTQQGYFVRPLGGSVEFQEHSQDALVREIQEEIDATITQPELLQVVEDFFEHRGRAYHDIVFLYQAHFVDEILYQQPRINCQELDGTVFQAYWLSLDKIKEKQYRIVPKGLEDILTKLTAG
ncbi:NUDIX hydrolase [Microscilla marina]|uniref:Nudix hydrolase n=1 Tax=Microscilla marina ATCC 23134 TaxID=313606 RepID=A1ZSE4_MICM2|nr:NUDIX domain-containing protein [Microscilla marina]EAY26692.1 nudix hydrolase [Microscilla marina ATCC 23134]